MPVYGICHRRQDISFDPTELPAPVFISATTVNNTRGHWGFTELQSTSVTTPLASKPRHTTSINIGEHAMIAYDLRT
ncbi:hypothetical protein T265_08754 [Opisthorchis viverrini]|uniref:Uncharacterized protein n=1 Tax=Opisthorchis viverrini TaxID=6198 RepID=A0A074ZCK6_OPIVI|nr:hypothetical protein T265_08754 [Opisthorchis viverrini]KER23342.1 hypothetical protein T265_08754 [Opisthorchis viverrini]